MIEKEKNSPPKEYFCMWMGCNISGVAARNCNNLFSLETYQCKYQKTCVAKEGLEAFAKTLAEPISETAREIGCLLGYGKSPKDELFDSGI